MLGLRSTRLLLLALVSAIAPIACDVQPAEGPSALSAPAAAGGQGTAAPQPGYVLDVELPTETTRGSEATPLTKAPNWW